MGPRLLRNSLLLSVNIGTKKSGRGRQVGVPTAGPSIGDSQLSTKGVNAMALHGLGRRVTKGLTRTKLGTGWWGWRTHFQFGAEIESNGHQLGSVDKMVTMLTPLLALQCKQFGKMVLEATQTS